MSEIKDYTTSVEDLFIQFFVSDPELFVRCKAIVNPSHFKDRVNSKAIKFILEHTDDYNAMPTVEQIKGITGKSVEPIENMSSEHIDWFLIEYEGFARHKAIERVILDSPDLLMEGRYGEVEKAVKDAVATALIKDLGTDYFSDPKSRLEEVLNSRGAISTGWKDIDNALYGGMNRGELAIFAGQSGAGKSLFLQNLAVNWAELGMNVVYITLELSENLCAMRLDAMISGCGTRDVIKNIDEVNLHVKSFQKKNKGLLQLKQLKNGCNVNDLKAYIKEYEIQQGIKVDAILVDYLDLMMPASAKVSPSDLFVKDKYVSEELRNTAFELDILMVSASQLNRGSYDELEFDHSNIAGGISKVNTCDNLIGIFTSTTMKENGRYQVQFMKTRSSSGVGSKVDLAFNIRSLRISDLDENDEGSMNTQSSSIINSLKRGGTIADDNKKSPSKASGNTGNLAKPSVAAMRNMIKNLD